MMPVRRETLPDFLIPGMGSLVGVLIGLLFIQATFVRVLHPMTRDRIMLEAIASPAYSPKVVVFGSSTAMCGMDAHKLGAALGLSALNLSAGARRPIESLFYYQDIPESVDLVIQFADPAELIFQPDLSEDRYNAFHIFGYRPDGRMIEVLRSTFPEQATMLLSQASWRRGFEARWALRTFIDEGFRDLLRKDLSVRRAAYDLYAPSPYSKKVSDRVLRRDIARRLGRWSKYEVVANPRAGTIFRAMAKRAAEQEVSLLFVIPPEHPTVTQAIGDPPTHLLEAFFTELASTSKVGVLNASRLLTEDQFIDAVHPTLEGAALLTQLIADSAREFF